MLRETERRCRGHCRSSSARLEAGAGPCAALAALDSYPHAVKLPVARRCRNETKQVLGPKLVADARGSRRHQSIRSHDLSKTTARVAQLTKRIGVELLVRIRTT